MLVAHLLSHMYISRTSVPVQIPSRITHSPFPTENDPTHSTKVLFMQGDSRCIPDTRVSQRMEICHYVETTTISRACGARHNPRHDHRHAVSSEDHHADPRTRANLHVDHEDRQIVHRVQAVDPDAGRASGRP
jgi:hypothetical protein